MQQNGPYLILSGSVKMTEGKRNWSEFQSNFSRQIYVPALDSSPCTLWGLSFDWGSLRANAGRDNHQWTTYSGNGIILQATCLADTKRHLQ